MFGKKTQDMDSLAKAAWHDMVDGLSATEAGRRATTAWDVLAGRPAPGRAWPVIRAAALGAVAGWAAAELYHRRRPQIDEAVEKVGAELRDAKHTVDERLARAKATPGSPIDKAKAAVYTPHNSQSTLGT
jgi:hypothetical protein